MTRAIFFPGTGSSASSRMHGAPSRAVRRSGTCTVRPGSWGANAGKRWAVPFRSCSESTISGGPGRTGRGRRGSFVGCRRVSSLPTRTSSSATSRWYGSGTSSLAATNGALRLGGRHPYGFNQGEISCGSESSVPFPSKSSRRSPSPSDGRPAASASRGPSPRAGKNQPGRPVSPPSPRPGVSVGGAPAPGAGERPPDPPERSACAGVRPLRRRPPGRARSTSRRGPPSRPSSAIRRICARRRRQAAPVPSTIAWSSRRSGAERRTRESFLP